MKSLSSLVRASAVAALTVLPGLSHAASPAPVGHVFIITLENENGSTTFGSGSKAPYLAQTLVSEGAYVPNYYGIGHHSADNYIAMIGGQPPNSKTQYDCTYYKNFIVKSGGTADIPKGYGCVYPASISTLAAQLDAKNLTWKGYMEDMGNTPSREAATCGHPAIGKKDNTQKATSADQYATRHNPFMYYHSIIDNQAYCDAHVVNFTPLATDLQQIATTPNFSFITPNLCDDGHDSKCANGTTGGLPQVNTWLQQWVPTIMNSPAFKHDGLLIITFDEAESDDTACCNEPTGPNTKRPGLFGPGGGKVGAVMLSPFIKPGTVSNTAYNHYSMLKSLEDIYGVSYLGEAAQSGLVGFGSDIFNNVP